MELFHVIIDNAASQYLTIGTNDLHNIAGMKMSARGFNTDRKQAAPATDQRFFSASVYRQRPDRGGEEAQPLFLPRQRRAMGLKVGAAAVTAQGGQ